MCRPGVTTAHVITSLIARRGSNPTFVLVGILAACANERTVLVPALKRKRLSSGQNRYSAHNAKGMGSMTSVTPPMRLHAGPTPSLWKNAVLNKGNAAPVIERKKSLPARIEAT